MFGFFHVKACAKWADELAVDIVEDEVVDEVHQRVPAEREAVRTLLSAYYKSAAEARECGTFASQCVHAPTRPHACDSLSIHGLMSIMLRHIALIVDEAGLGDHAVDPLLRYSFLCAPKMQAGELS